MMEGEEVASVVVRFKRVCNQTFSYHHATSPSHSLGEASSGFRKEQGIGQLRDKKEAVAPGTDAQQDAMAI